MWMKTGTGRLVNLDRCREIWAEPGHQTSQRIVAELDSGVKRILVDDLAAQHADELMTELTRVLLHASEVRDGQLDVRGN